jgi:hypothetical protein
MMQLRSYRRMNEGIIQVVERAAIYRTNKYCISDVSCLRLSCCINDFNFYVHYIWLIHVGRIERSQNRLYETLNIIPFCKYFSKHHHHQSSSSSSSSSSLKSSSLLRYQLFNINGPIWY